MSKGFDTAQGISRWSKRGLGGTKRKVEFKGSSSGVQCGLRRMKRFLGLQEGSKSNQVEYNWVRGSQSVVRGIRGVQKGSRRFKRSPSMSEQV